MAQLRVEKSAEMHKIARQEIQLFIDKVTPPLIHLGK